jgi:hypothetical protein
MFKWDFTLFVHMQIEKFSSFSASVIETKTNSKAASESIVGIIAQHFYRHWSVFSSEQLNMLNMLADFWNNFQDHRRLPEQLLEPQAAILQPGQAS